MKYFVFITATIFLFGVIGCKKSVDKNALPYYQFTDDDKSKLLISFNVNNQFVYKNQNGNEIKFKVITSENGKTNYSFGALWDSYVQVYFYYDRQEIIMQYAEGYKWTSCEIYLQRYPVGSNYLTQEPVEGTPAFTGYIRFPLWNVYTDTLTLDNSIFIDFNSGTNSMIINGKTYPKVRIFQSGSTQVLEPNNILPSLPKNVNKLYYDQNAGIVRFDDVNGGKWLLQ